MVLSEFFFKYGLLFLSILMHFEQYGIEDVFTSPSVICNTLKVLDYSVFIHICITLYIFILHIKKI